MAIRPVRIYGDPVLREKARPIDTFDEPLARLVEDMFETMRAYRGVGLAGNQVGIPQRVLVIEVPPEEEGAASQRLALVNPRLSEASGQQVEEEGCLSIPGVYDDVKRAQQVKVQAQDPQGRPLEFVAEGYLARIVQHEVDHLDGVLFTDRLSPLRRQFLRRSLEALARGEMPEGYEQLGGDSR
ncbi:MAG TPA: peptide deformylase [Candidatus Eisenbacteria bacterium]|nr:peptide deformylase [Candidatus Eisenbacteria bacterium]